MPSQPATTQTPLAVAAAAVIAAGLAWPAAGSERGEPIPDPGTAAQATHEAEERAPAAAEAAAEEAGDIFDEAERQHELLFKESRYPSAATCGTCHPKHYEEWSVSQHSYAQLSPVYMAINNFLNFSTSALPDQTQSRLAGSSALTLRS